MCSSSANKSCSKEWYKVVSWGDYYYNLGCSSNEPKAEMEEKRVNKFHVHQCQAQIAI